jgi:predicted RNA-binding protein Jag
VIDISKQTVKINCPECKGSITVSLKQVADEIRVKCICGQSIQLKDSNGSSRKAIHDINKSFKDLENTFKKFGR